MDRKYIIKEVNRLVSSGLRKSAIDIISEYLENTPNDPFVLRALGRIYLLEKKPDLAIKYLQLSLNSNQAETALNSNSTSYGFDELDHDDLHYIENASAETDVDYSYAIEEQIECHSKPPTFIDYESNDLSIGLFEPQALDDQSEHNADKQIEVILSIENDDVLEQEDIEYTGFSFEALADDVDFSLPPQIDVYDDSFNIDVIALPEIDNEVEDDDIEEIFVDDEETSIEDEFDWYGLEDFDEIDEQGATDSFLEYRVTTEGKVDRIERAKQIASNVIDSYDWGIKNLPLLQQVFYENGWGAARVAIEHELARGLTPDELELAIYVRRLWTENEQYWISFIHVTSNQPNQETRAAYKNMSWREALRIIRVFKSLPSEGEIQLFVDQIYDDWYCSSRLQKQYKSFIRYIKYRTGSVRHTLPGNELFSFVNSYEHEALIDSTRDIIKFETGVDKLKQQGIDIEQMLITLEQKYEVILPLRTISDPYIAKANPKTTSKLKNNADVILEDEDEQDDDIIEQGSTKLFCQETTV